MICIPFIALFRQFTNMQKKLWRTGAVRSNRHANMGLESVLNEPQCKEIEYVYCIARLHVPEKCWVVGIYVFKFGEFDFLPHSLLKSVNKGK